MSNKVSRDVKSVMQELNLHCIQTYHLIPKDTVTELSCKERTHTSYTQILSMMGRKVLRVNRPYPRILGFWYHWRGEITHRKIILQLGVLLDKRWPHKVPRENLETERGWWENIPKMWQGGDENDGKQSTERSALSLASLSGHSPPVGGRGCKRLALVLSVFTRLSSLSLGLCI